MSHSPQFHSALEGIAAAAGLVAEVKSVAISQTQVYFGNAPAIIAQFTDLPPGTWVFLAGFSLVLSPATAPNLGCITGRITLYNYTTASNICQIPLSGSMWQPTSASIHEDSQYPTVPVMAATVLTAPATIALYLDARSASGSPTGASVTSYGGSTLFAIRIR
jgi:hypothetical protein